MKKNMKGNVLVATLVLCIAFCLVLPQASHSHGYYGGYGYGWWVPGAFIGGALLAAAIARPWYPPPVYY